MFTARIRLRLSVRVWSPRLPRLVFDTPHCVTMRTYVAVPFELHAAELTRKALPRRALGHRPSKCATCAARRRKWGWGKNAGGAREGTEEHRAPLVTAVLSLYFLERRARLSRRNVPVSTTSFDVRHACMGARKCVLINM